MSLTARALVVLSLTAPVAASARPPANAPEVEAPPAWRSDEGKKDVWRDLAHWYADNGMPDQALEMVSRLNAEGEATPEIRLIQGMALMRQGIPDEAKAILERVAKETPRDPRPLEQLAVLYADAGDVDRAISTLERALDLGATSAATQNNLGFLLMGQSRCADAVPPLEKAMAADPSTVRYRNNLGFALVCAGDAQRALQLFRTTGTEADARYNMGVAYERLGKLPSALLQYQAAVGVAPTHEAATAALSRLAHPEEPSPETDPSQGVPQ